jgi:type VI protein secretion system component Hcp
MAEIKSYLQMEPIIGDSKNPQFKKAVEIDSWSFNQTMPYDSGAVNSNRRTELSVILSKDSRAGKQFFQYLRRPQSNRIDRDFDSGQQVFKEAVLTIEKLSSNNRLKKYTVMKMSPVIVVSVHQDAGSDNGFLSQISLRFRKIEYIIPD